MEIEIVPFVINESMKLEVPPDRQKQIPSRRRSVAHCCVFDLKLNGINLAQVILTLWVVYELIIIDVPICENIYTPSVFCYDKHKKNFDIQFSLKRHETV